MAVRPATVDLTGSLAGRGGGNHEATITKRERPLPDVIELIEKDHREVEQLFSKFESTRDLSIPSEICDELDRHAAGEEQVVYPAIEAEVPGGKQFVQEGSRSTEGASADRANPAH